ncbi:MAG TPA: diacylglycerol kinase family protein, partial [Thermoanaerobaculia bacterium]|nr:diacylglycerol kinase family protein [Thermoanaerobaculia bacterium]
TRAPGHAAELARAAREDGGFASVFAVGGDGILREAASGLLGGELPLAPLPAGTANVLARVLGIPRDPLLAAELLAARPPAMRRLDVGMVESSAPEGGAGSLPPTPFLMMTSRGLDARALERLPPSWKRRFGRGGVVLSGLRELLRKPDPSFGVRIDHGAERRASYLAVCNIPLYGGGFVLAPGASPFDRALEVVALAAPGRRALLAFAGRVVSRRAPAAARATREVSLPGSGPVWLQVDGDALAVELPARIRLAEATLPVLAPFGAT